jgi:bacterioferritin
MIGENIKEVLECDMKGEKIAIETYTRGRDICRKHEDYVTMGIFEHLLKDEEGHLDFLETQLELLQRIGVENYGLLNSGSANEAD